MGLQPDEAVHDVHARLFEHAGPVDVGLLVEARFELDQRDDLLAVLGRLDERARRSRCRCPRCGRCVCLIASTCRIGRGLVDEGLDRRRERVVRMVHQHVAAAAGPGRSRRCTSPRASTGWVCGVHGASLSSGRSSAYRSQSPERSSGPSTTLTAASAISSSRQSSSRTSGDIVVSTSRRTTRPNFERRCSTVSIASRRSSSSSSRSKSASRVTRNGWCATHVHPREQRVELCRDQLLERQEPLAVGAAGRSAGAAAGPSPGRSAPRPSSGRGRARRG